MAVHEESSRLFTPAVIGALRLRSRLIRSAAFEGTYADGEPTVELVDHHRELAAGGVAITTVASIQLAHCA